MAFVQKFFTSFGKYADGETRTGELNRLWYDSGTNTIRIGDGTAGGKIVSGGGLGSTVHEAATPPSDPKAGDMWWDTTDGNLYVYYDNSWVSASSFPSSYATQQFVTDSINAIVFPEDNDTAYATPADITSAINAIVFPPTDRIVSPNTLHTAVIANTGTTTFGGDVVPGASTYTLGTVALPWKDIFLSQGSIVIADTDPAVDGVSISNNNKYIVIDRGGLKVTANDNTHEIFQLDNTGRLILKSLLPGNTTTAALDLIGNLTGTTLPTGNAGVMLHATGVQDVPSRIYLDGIGTQLSGTNAYPAFVGHYARGSVASPQPAQTNDILARYGANAWATDLGFNSITNVRIDMVATETQSSTSRGTQMQFWTTPAGTAVPEPTMLLDYDGINFTNATNVNAGITFKGGTQLSYFPSIAGNAGKILRTDGTSFFWANETVPTGSVVFKGDWDASTNTPSVSDASGSNGWEYIVSVAGTQDLGGGSVAYAVGDQIIHNGTNYVRIPAQTAQVQADWTETNSALPAYIKHKPTLATVATSGSYADLSNKPFIPAAQVNSDWNATTGLGQILNKPTIPTQYTDTLARAAISLTSNTPSGTTSTLTYVGGVFTFTSAAAPAPQIQSDWNQTNNASLDFIKNKPSIPAAQVQSDWNAVSGLGVILNKPTIPSAYTLPTATTSVLGGVKVDGTTVSINGSGVISAIAAVNYYPVTKDVTLVGDTTFNFSFATDVYIRMKYDTALTIGFQDMSAGKVVSIVAVNTSNNARTVTLGLAQGHATNSNASTVSISPGRMAMLRYVCFGTSSSDVYCEVSYQ